MSSSSNSNYTKPTVVTSSSSTPATPVALPASTPHEENDKYTRYVMKMRELEKQWIRNRVQVERGGTPSGMTCRKETVFADDNVVCLMSELAKTHTSGNHTALGVLKVEGLRRGNTAAPPQLFIASSNDGLMRVRKAEYTGQNRGKAKADKFCDTARKYVQKQSNKNIHVAKPRPRHGQPLSYVAMLEYISPKATQAERLHYVQRLVERIRDLVSCVPADKPALTEFKTLFRDFDCVFSDTDELFHVDNILAGFLCAPVDVDDALHEKAERLRWLCVNGKIDERGTLGGSIMESLFERHSDINTACVSATDKPVLDTIFNELRQDLGYSGCSLADEKHPIQKRWSAAMAAFVDSSPQSRLLALRRWRVIAATSTLAHHLMLDWYVRPTGRIYQSVAEVSNFHLACCEYNAVAELVARLTATTTNNNNHNDINDNDINDNDDNDHDDSGTDTQQWQLDADAVLVWYPFELKKKKLISKPLCSVCQRHFVPHVAALCLPLIHEKYLIWLLEAFAKE